MCHSQTKIESNPQLGLAVMINPLYYVAQAHTACVYIQTHLLSRVLCSTCSLIPKEITAPNTVRPKLRTQTPLKAII